MHFRKFGRQDWQASILGFGAMRLPTIDINGTSSQIDELHAIELLREAIDEGVNFVDTAYPYHGGQSELVVGKALKDGYRTKVKLASKAPLWLIHSPADFDRYLDEQLVKLQTETLDCYLFHAVSAARWEDPIVRFELIERAERAKQAGKIGSIGFSYHDAPDVFTRVLDAYHWDLCLVQYNYMDANSQAGQAGVKAAADRGLAVVVMEPLLGGRLANPPEVLRAQFSEQFAQRSPAEWALQWLWNQPEVTTVLSGMSTLKQLRQNLRSADRGCAGSFRTNDREFIAQLQEAFRSRTKIQCTECHYCLPCPNGVRIPTNFSTYNGVFFYDDLQGARRNYQIFLAEGNASACSGCGLCEQKCPQKIPITQWMPEIARLLGG